MSAGRYHARVSDIIPGNIRRRLRVTGRVQGVGFRPCVYRLACRLGLTGFVGNDAKGVFVEVEGTPDQVDRFVSELPDSVPDLAQIVRIQVTSAETAGDRDFRIVASRDDAVHDAEITPDLAVCPDCLRELFDTHDPRSAYPLINCMHCGPRYSIVRDVPYDRVNTTMAGFEMCAPCRSEYDDPSSRRFHAQPNACAACGPRVWFLTASRVEMQGDPIRTAARWLADGAILAIKGIGGFHLACLAGEDRPVTMLRLRKRRDAKPFALMVPTIEAARQIADLDQAAAEALLSPARPIVLARKANAHGISEWVAPGTPCFGLMLPYTPIQHLLFAHGLGPLVMTSANISDEPLCCENEEALQRLAGIADAFLLHNRPIERRVDDSIVLATGLSAAPVVPIRRSRGCVPEPIRLAEPVPEPILALGGDLKSTICIVRGDQAVLSEHHGDLANPVAYRSYLSSIPHLARLLHVVPGVVAHDLHPDYHSTRYARGLAQPLVGVQHHHAHIVSCMAENGVSRPVVGIACDGTGYGTDGAIWGCEILVCDAAQFRRAAHLRYFPLPGGDAAAADTWRPALGLLRDTFGPEWLAAIPRRLVERLPEAAVPVDQTLRTSRRVPLTSSLGRLFDAVAWLLGVCERNRYEAEAAVTLEGLASECASTDPLRHDWHQEASRPVELDVRPMLRQMLEQSVLGVSAAQLARAFHEGVALMLVEAATWAAAREGISQVVLSGGCFANRILLERVTRGLCAAGYEVLLHRRVPPGDGGLALGQAVVAAARLRSTGTSQLGRN